MPGPERAWRTPDQPNLDLSPFVYGLGPAAHISMRPASLQLAPLIFWLTYEAVNHPSRVEVLARDLSRIVVGQG
jgi:hypothetical protein